MEGEDYRDHRIAVIATQDLRISLLLAGDVDEALDQAEQAVARNPQDEINRNLLTVIREVKDGRRPQPKTLAELEA